MGDLQDRLYLVAQAADEEERYSAHCMQPYHVSLRVFLSCIHDVIHDDTPNTVTVEQVPLSHLRYSSRTLDPTLAGYALWEVMLCLLEGTLKPSDIPPMRAVKLPRAAEIRANVCSRTREDPGDFIGLDGALVVLDNVILYLLRTFMPPSEKVSVYVLTDPTYRDNAFDSMARHPVVMDGLTCVPRLVCCSRVFASEIELIQHVLLQHKSRSVPTSPCLAYLPNDRKCFLSSDFEPGTLLREVLDLAVGKRGVELKEALRRAVRPTRAGAANSARRVLHSPPLGMEASDIVPPRPFGV